MIDPVHRNSVFGCDLASCEVVRSRPLLTAGAQTEHAIPVDVRVRFGRNNPPLEARTIPTSLSATDRQPVGMILDCYM
jgi:hypothetical protein